MNTQVNRSVPAEVAENKDASMVSIRPELAEASDAPLPKIFLTPVSILQNGFVEGKAIAEDGEPLSGHMSSGETWLKHDLGLLSNLYHEHYFAKYADGFTLVWVGIDPDNQPAGFVEARELYYAGPPAEA